MGQPRFLELPPPSGGGARPQADEVLRPSCGPFFVNLILVACRLEVEGFQAAGLGLEGSRSRRYVWVYATWIAR